MNGACASFASRRAISVLPQPVGPIIRMFLGTTSSRIASGSCCRRQRLRSAIATARLASFWPTMKRSSSETISRGENSFNAGTRSGLQGFDGDIAVGVDADVGGNVERLLDDLLGAQRPVEQCARGGERVVAAGADAGDARFRLQHVAGAGQDQRYLLVGDDHHGFEPAQVAVGAPVLGELDRGAQKLAGV